MAQFYAPRAVAAMPTTSAPSRSASTHPTPAAPALSLASDPTPSTGHPIRLGGDGDSLRLGSGWSVEAIGWVLSPDGLVVGWSGHRAGCCDRAPRPAERSSLLAGRAGDQGCTRPAKGSVTR